MALFFNKIQRINPSDPKAPRKWYIILRSIGIMKERDVAKEIADETTLNPKEAEMSIYQLQKVVVKALLDGKTVQLGELGTFQLTVKSKGVDDEKDANASLAEKINIRFMPSSSLKKAIAEATLTPQKK